MTTFNGENFSIVVIFFIKGYNRIEILNEKL